MFEVRDGARRISTRSKGDGNIVAQSVTINMQSAPVMSLLGMMGASMCSSQREVALRRRFRNANEANRECLISLAEVISETEQFWFDNDRGCR